MFCATSLATCFETCLATCLTTCLATCLSCRLTTCLATCLATAESVELQLHEGRCYIGQCFVQDGRKGLSRHFFYQSRAFEGVFYANCCETSCTKYVMLCKTEKIRLAYSSAIVAKIRT